MATATVLLLYTRQEDTAKATRGTNEAAAAAIFFVLSRAHLLHLAELEEVLGRERGLVAEQVHHHLSERSVDHHRHLPAVLHGAAPEQGGCGRVRGVCKVCGGAWRARTKAFADKLCVGLCVSPVSWVVYHEI